MRTAISIANECVPLLDVKILCMSPQDTLHKQHALIQALVLNWEKELKHVQLFETHISWVVVVGELAYKFKKAVHFDFLDFSTLLARHFYCQEELRLNRRLAPDIYLDVVPVTGSSEHPTVDQPGVPIEYAVKMLAFDQQSLWSHRLKNGLISTAEIDALAQEIAAFHKNVGTTAVDSPWGEPKLIYAIADKNFIQIAGLVNASSERRKIQELWCWEMQQRRNLNNAFEQRKAQGFVRECHGDLHGGNILTLNDKVEAFDCIEFNEGMRWIDVMNDIAFTCMDMQFHGRRDLAARFLNLYLEMTGDYEGLSVLRYYQVQRAMVRCKVSLLRTAQLTAGSQNADTLDEQGKHYLDFAVGCIQLASPAIIITHGYSGSGKSTLAGSLIKLLGVIRLRSDVERKRMHGLDAMSRAENALAQGLYDPTSTRRTYERLGALARHVVESGYPVVVDAAFLRREQRQLLAALATELGVPFFILDVHASKETMRTRLASRAKLNQNPSDAGIDVLEYQLAHHDPLSNSEMKQTISINFETEMDAAAIEMFCLPILNRLQGQPR